MWGHAAIQFGNQVGATDAAQRLLDATALFGFVPEEELALGQLLLWRFGAEHWLQRIRIVACVPRFGGVGEWRGSKILYLLEMEIEVLGNHCQFGHILFLTAWVAGDEVGNDLLAKTLLAINLIEDSLELVELLERGLAHEVEYTIAGVLGSYLESTRNMTGNQLAGVLHSSLIAGLVLATM